MSRIVVVCNDIPLPQNSGGRIDVWRHVEALSEAGNQVALVTWFDEGRDGSLIQDRLEQLSPVIFDYHIRPIRRGFLSMLKRLACMLDLPSHAASRRAAMIESEVVEWAAGFKPDVVLLHGLYGVSVAKWMSSHFSIPIVYRSHNIEHVYMRRQLSLASSLRQKIGLFFNLWKLEKVEWQTISSAAKVLDISYDDISFWRRRGRSDIEWLPPVVNSSFIDNISSSSDLCWDVCYFGNLNTPNNVDAVRWLLVDILPLTNLPQLRVVLAGSNPSQVVLDLVARDARVELVANPPDIGAILSKSKVLVNPVRAGSGVNLKSVEMLFSDATLLSTSVGVGGLPSKVKDCFGIFNDASGFAGAIREDVLRAGRIELDPKRIEARTTFLASNVGSLLTRALQ